MHKYSNNFQGFQNKFCSGENRDRATPPRLRLESKAKILDFGDVVRPRNSIEHEKIFHTFEFPRLVQFFKRKYSNRFALTLR